MCVCSMHQNTLLLIDALNIPESYKVLMSKLVCSLDSRICMIHRCENCPGNDNLRKFLIETVKERDGQVSFNTVFL